jgi:peptidoglycan/LPS O-acetylase OafA/YrhL
MNGAENLALRRRIPELDGLRGTAILIVLIYHYITQDYGARMGSVAAHLQRIVGLGGGAGVDLFFVLSGFLIGGILLDSRTSPSYFKPFYARRFFRIIPLYYGWIVLFIALAALAGPISRTFPHLAANLTLDFHFYPYFLFLQNIVSVGLSGLGVAWFASLWSLAVEEQFYLVAPLGVRLLSKRTLYKSLAVIVVAAPLLRLFLLKVEHVNSGLVYFLTPCRADTLAVGMIAAALLREPKSREWLSSHVKTLYGLFGILLAGFIGLWIWSPNYYALPMAIGGYTWVALFFGVVLLLALQDASGPIAAAMRLRWLREIGTVSYCMYIIHLVANVICHRVVLHADPEISTAKGVAVTILAAVLTYALAKISWICFERPLLQMGHRFKFSSAR